MPAGDRFCSKISSVRKATEILFQQCKASTCICRRLEQKKCKVPKLPLNLVVAAFFAYTAFSSYYQAIFFAQKTMVSVGVLQKDGKYAMLPFMQCQKENLPQKLYLSFYTFRQKELA